MDKENSSIDDKSIFNNFIKFDPKTLSRQGLISLFKNEVRWNLSNAKYTSQQIEILFEQIKKPENLCYLWLYWNKIESICKLVILPEYAKLKILSLGGNNILSVQPLQHANMNTLEELFLWNNRLTRIDSLRKMYVPSLNFLDLSSNFIIEFRKISELHSTNLQILNFQNNNGMGCIDYVAKLLSGNGQKIISFNESNLVRVMGQRAKKGRRQARSYKFPSQKIEYK